MNFIGSLNYRQAQFNNLIHPHINDMSAEDALGLYNFNLRKIVSPTQEFLYSLDKTLGIGYFNTSLNIYKLAGIQFKPPYENYQIFMSVGTEYIEINTYLATKGAKLVYCEDLVYIISSKHIPIVTNGIVLISINHNDYSFTTTPGTDTIHLDKNLYIKTTIPFVESIPTTNYKIIDSIFNTSGNLVDGAVLGTDISLFYAQDPDKILSNSAIITYTYNGENKFQLVELDYVFWSRDLGLLNNTDLKHKLTTIYDSPVDSIISVNVLLTIVDVINTANSKPDKVFTELFRLAKDPKYKIDGIINNETIGLRPIDGYSEIFDINFGLDEDYFPSIKKISRRVARTLIGLEYSKIHYDIDISLITADKLTFKVHNKYQTEISIFINGYYYHGDFERRDALSISTITITKANLLTYGPLEFLEAIVEPTFTKRYDVPTNKGHNNLLEVHGEYTLKLESDLYINGCLYDKSFYKYMNIEGRGFVSLEKYVDVDNATIIFNPQVKYDRTTVNSITDLDKYEILDEFSKVFMSGRLIPNKYLVDLYDGKKIDVLGELTYPDNRDNKITVMQLKGNPYWGDFLKDANTDSLITGVILVDTTNKLFRHIKYSEIIKRIKYVDSTNSMLNDVYSPRYHSDNVMARSEYVYDILTIGRKLGMDSNQSSMTIDMSSEISSKYPSMIEGKMVIINANDEVSPMADVHELLKV